MQQPSSTPKHQSLLTALCNFQLNTRKHALLMNLHSKVIRIPLCTVHHWKQLKLSANGHLEVNICVGLPLRRETEWVGHCTITVTTPFLSSFSPDCSSSLHLSLYLTLNYRLMDVQCALLIFVTFVMNRQLKKWRLLCSFWYTVRND